MSLLGSGKHVGHEDGESWLVSYADMVTLLFGFFVILYSLSQVDETKFSEFQKEIAETFGGEYVEKFGSEVGHVSANRQLRAFQMMMAMVSPGEDMNSVVKKIEKETQSDQAMGEISKAIKKRMEKTDGVLRAGQANKELLIDLALPADTLFSSGSDQLMPAAKARIKEIADELVRMNGVLGIAVVGHSDSVQPPVRPGAPDNWALSSLRASAVARALIANGVDRRGVSVSGVGDLEPLFAERGADGKIIKENLARNRRVHLIVKKAALDGGT